MTSAPLPLHHNQRHKPSPQKMRFGEGERGTSRTLLCQSARRKLCLSEGANVVLKHTVP